VPISISKSGLELEMSINNEIIFITDLEPDKGKNRVFFKKLIFDRNLYKYSLEKICGVGTK
jgi:hypothetical protein